MDNGSDKDTPDAKASDRATEPGSGSSPKTAGAGNEAKAQSREDRLAEALRANLRRRKSAARGRKAED